MWRLGTRRAARFLPLLLPILAIAPWFLFTRLAGLEPDQVGSGIPAGELGERLMAVPLAFARLGTDRAWSALPLLLLLGLVARALRPNRDLGVAWIILLVYLAATQIVYLTTPTNFDHLLNSTLHRIVQVLVPAAVFLSVREVAMLQAGGHPVDDRIEN
jgi:hypothetical protein